MTRNALRFADETVHSLDDNEAVHALYTIVNICKHYYKKEEILQPGELSPNLKVYLTGVLYLITWLDWF